MRELLIAYERINDDDIAVVCVCVCIALICVVHTYTRVFEYIPKANSVWKFPVATQRPSCILYIYSMFVLYGRERQLWLDGWWHSLSVVSICDKAENVEF